MKIFPGILGMTGVILGAFGAHALKPRLIAANTLSVWETAVQYQLIHAVALLALAIAGMTAFAHQRPTLLAWLRRASWAWIAGIVLFSGSLYWVALGGPRWLWPFAPAGGLSLVAGWLSVIVAAIVAKPDHDNAQNASRK